MLSKCTVLWSSYHVGGVSLSPYFWGTLTFSSHFWPIVSFVYLVWGSLVLPIDQLKHLWVGANWRLPPFYPSQSTKHCHSVVYVLSPSPLFLSQYMNIAGIVLNSVLGTELPGCGYSLAGEGEKLACRHLSFNSLSLGLSGRLAQLPTSNQVRPKAEPRSIQNMTALHSPHGVSTVRMTLKYSQKKSELFLDSSYRVSVYTSTRWEVEEPASQALIRITYSSSEKSTGSVVHR